MMRRFRLVVASSVMDMEIRAVICSLSFIESWLSYVFESRVWLLPIGNRYGTPIQVWLGSSSIGGAGCSPYFRMLASSSG